MTGNSAIPSGGGIYGCMLYNSIVYYNDAPDGANYFEDNTSGPITHSCTTPLPANGVGNIAGSPLFMDMAAGDFRLWEGSPCIDAGMNLMGFTHYDVADTRILSYNHEPTDILGNTRFIDGNGDGKVAWDIGAYEFNSFKPPRFTAPPQLAWDGWKLTIAGATNKWVRVQRSSDLRNWEDMPSYPFVFVGESGVAQCTDWETGQKVMFYRTVVP